MKNIILKNRYTLLVVTLVAYIGVLVAEGAITGREVRVFEFENPFFDFNVNNFEGFRESRDSDDSRSDSGQDRGENRGENRDDSRDEDSGDV
jgi:hypothetical protein